MKNEPLKVIFFGTPEFSVASLDILIVNGYNVVAVVTAPDKPAGRGLELKLSAVKEYALKKNLKILQPENLKSESFINQLNELKPTLGIVIAFRKLPKEVWSLPVHGTFNLHASLLPHYRGAAPINWAIINGEKETGVTTFFLNEDIDTGSIIFREKENISQVDSAEDLYSRLMKLGAQLMLKTVRAIETDNYTLQIQSSLLKSGEVVKMAPKIFKPDCKINWEKSSDQIYNFVRGLSPYPASWTELKKNNDTLSLKIFQCKKEVLTHQLSIGTIYSDGKTFVKVVVSDGFIHLLDLQLAGRKKMQTEEFLRGFSFEGWKIN